MGAVIILAIVVIFVSIIIGSGFAKKNRKRKFVKTEYKYRKVKSLLTPAERSFFGVLNKAVGDNAQIFAKVRVADAITPVRGQSKSYWQSAFNKISRKHFDYIICDKERLSVICAIELNDSSHNLPQRTDRDNFLNSACQSAGIPLIEIPAQTGYSVDKVKQSIGRYIQHRQFDNNKADNYNRRLREKI